MSTPSITAVMITGKSGDRFPLARQAVESFLQQTWPQKQLLIINDSHLTPHEARVLREPHPLIRELVMPPAGNLGSLRNIGLDLAEGDYIMQWDDDDWSHKERMARQLWSALERPGAPCLLTHQVRYSFPDNTAYTYFNEQGIAGTILHPQTKLRYPVIPLSEDAEFLQKWPERQLLDNTHQPYLYLRFFHGGNSWDREHVMRKYAEKKWRGTWVSLPEQPGYLPGISALYLNDVLKRHYNDRTRRKPGKWEWQTVPRLSFRPS